MADATSQQTENRQDEAELEPLTGEERRELAQALRDYRAGRVHGHADAVERLRRLDRRTRGG